MKPVFLSVLLISCTVQIPPEEPTRLEPPPEDPPPAASVATEDSPEYVRSEWGSWRDEDKDCQDARQEALIAESEVPVTFKEEKKCKVATGRWTCPFTGTIITDPSKIDIDHMVPLKEAWLSGGDVWERDKKKAYYNNLGSPEHLLATSASGNRSKGSRGPNEWMPPKTEYWCTYLRDWVSVKNDWALKMDPEEARFIINALIENCIPK